VRFYLPPATICLVQILSYQTPQTTPSRKPIYTHLYVQVLLAIAIGVALGHLRPDIGIKLKPLGDGFIKLIKMMIAPIIFATVVVGIAKIGDMKKVGRVGLKALIYFEAVTTIALVIGLIVINVVRPGVGMNVDVSKLTTKGLPATVTDPESRSPVNILLHIIPDTAVSAFANGEILQVLLIAILFGVALAHLGERGTPLVHLLDDFSHVLFGVIAIIMRLAPIGAFGAMAFTIGSQGLRSLGSLALLMLCVYTTCLLFIFIVLGLICHATGFSLWQFLRYIKDELVIVLGTSSSEAALPRMMTKLEHVGCAKPVVDLVIPTGYSFNLDGTSIYLTMAAIFIAQATNHHLNLGQQLYILALLLLTSKGSAAVTGGGFITLAATLQSTSVPVAGLALLLGIDRFMSEARALTNLIGNGVATMVVARWEGALDLERARSILGQPADEAGRLETRVAGGELVEAAEGRV